MRFITDYHRLNRKFVKKPYPPPIIGKTMHQLEAFHYVTVLDLNMGYYTTRLSDASQDMKTIVTEFGKFGYNRLPMGICALDYIFQAKVDRLLGYI